MHGNHQLTTLMAQAGFLKDDGSVGLKVFARAASRFGARAYTHTYVRRWLEGTIPRDAGTRRAIAAALSARLGRTVSVDELGFDRSDKLPADLGLRYPSTPVDSIRSLTNLWLADLGRTPALTAASANVAAWNDAALSWVVEPTNGKITSKGNRAVGAIDITRVRATTELFESLDAQYGGGHARSSLIGFLQADVTHILNGSYTDRTGRELFRSAARAILLAAWMSYDSGLHALAQRYFIQALRLAESSGDRLFAGSILGAMSHQATFLGHFREAVNLARAARIGTEANAAAALTAYLHAMEARALAHMGDAYACDQAMSAAVHAFEKQRSEGRPDWFQYFNDSELSAELSHCNRDLGRAGDSARYAAQSAGTNGDQVRSDFFVTMVLAASHLDQGHEEEACRIALLALEAGEQLRSARCSVYVDEFRERLRRLDDSRVAREFCEQASHTRLWDERTSER